MKASRLGGLAVGGPADVALRGAGGREHPLELHVGQHVGGAAEAELAAAGGVEGLEAGREDHAADFQLERLGRLIVVDGAGLADLGAQAALAGLEMDAVVAVDRPAPAARPAGWARSMQGRAVRYLSKSVRCGFTAAR